MSLVLVALSVVCARRASFVRSDLRRSPLIRIRGLSPLCADTPHIARSVAGRPGPDLGRRRKASTTVCLAGPAPGHRTYPSGGVRRTTGTWLFVLAGIVCFFCFRQEGFAATPEVFCFPFFHQKGFAATEKRQDMHGNLFEILPSFSFVLPRSPPYWA